MLAAHEEYFFTVGTNQILEQWQEAGKLK